MKKLLFLLLLPISVFAQSIPVPQNSFGTVADLRLQPGTANVQVLLNGITGINDGNGGTYMWNSTSTATDDGFKVIQVTGVTTGRWIRLVNSNTYKNSVTFSGITLQTSYNVTFPVAFTFTPVTVIVNPRSANAAALSYISNISSTGFTINFLTVPVLGTNNIVFDYIAIKN